MRDARWVFQLSWLLRLKTSLIEDVLPCRVDVKPFVLCTQNGSGFVSLGHTRRMARSPEAPKPKCTGNGAVAQACMLLGLSGQPMPAEVQKANADDAS